MKQQQLNQHVKINFFLKFLCYLKTFLNEKQPLFTLNNMYCFTKKIIRMDFVLSNKKFPIPTICLLFTLTIITQFTQAQNCAVNAGVDQTICITSALNLTGMIGLPQSNPAVVAWSQISGPSSVTFATPNAVNSNVTGYAPGNYVFQLSNKCADNINATDFVVVTVLPEPPTSLAGADVTQCSNSPVVLTANPVTSPNVGTWSATPSGGTFSPNVNTANATYTPPAGSATYTLTWTISNGFCTKSDNMLINVVSPTLPVNAGPDITLGCAGSCVTMAGSDPGLAPPQGGFWSLVSGPNTPVITNPTSKSTTVCGLQPGSYTLRWTVSGTCGSGFDDMVINVTNIFDAPISADGYLEVNCTTPRSNTAILQGTPLTAGETGIWTITSGQTGVTFSPNANTASVTVTGVATSSSDYVFKWTKTNAAGCTAAGTHYLRASSSIVSITTPANQTLACDATSTTFNISWSYPASGYLNSAPSLVSYPVGGNTALISKTNEAYNATVDQTFATVGMNVPGVYVYKVLYFNNCETAIRNIAITVSRTPGAVNAGSDIVLPCNTLSANPIGSSTSIGAGYAMNWTQVSGPNTATLAGTSTLSLGMSGMVQGVYKMRLSVSGGASCPSKTDDMLVTVTQSVPTIATAGVNATICYGNYQLAANTPNAVETGTWTVSPSAGISFIPNANTPNAKISGMLASTVYTLTWTVTNACGSKTATQVLTTTATQSPPIPDANIDQCVFGSGTLTAPLVGSAPAGSTITWAALDAGSSVTPSNTQNTTATITGANGSYRFIYTLSKAGCTSLSDTVVVTKSSVVVSNAGADISICAATVPANTTLAATAAAGGAWAQISGPTTATITTATSATSTVTNLAAGVYEFEWRIKNGVCSDVVDIMQIKVTQAPTVANAGPDQSICNGGYNTVVTLAGNNPSVGTGYWQIVSAPGGSYAITIVNPLLYNTTVTPGWTQGTYKLVWTTTNGTGCANSTDTMVVNMGVFAYAGGSTSLCNVTNTLLFGDVNTTGTWSYVSGPAGSIITTNSTNTATVSGLTTGVTTPNVYVYKYTLPAIGACPSTSSNYNITNYPKPSQANAGADVQLCFNQNTVTLTGNTPTAGTGVWVLESGPNTPTAGTANGNAVDTVLNNIVPGLYSYQYQINTDGACIASVDKVQIVKEIPANAKPDIRVCNATSVNLNATAAIINTAVWSYISGPAGSSITSVNAPNTSVTGMVPGTYTYRWTISSPAGLGCAVNSDDVQVIIDAPVTGMNAGLDTTFCQGTVNPFTIGTAAQGGITYSWASASLLSNAAIAQPQFTGVNNAGTYTYTVKGTIGSCEAFDQVNIVIKPKPITAFSITSPGCNGVLTLASVVGGSTYSWNFGANASPSTASTAGPHTVTWSTTSTKTVKLIVTSANGCADSSSVTFTPACALPITLTKFSTAWQSNTPQITWQVENAINFKNFILQRSFDGVNFNKIATLDYIDNKKDYQYLDNGLINLNGKIFYRLIMVDIDGRTSYSEIKNLVAIQKSEVMVYPNPFTVQVEVLVNVVKIRERVEVALYKDDGRLLLTKQQTLNRGNNTITLANLSIFPEGLYLLKITREDGVSTKKLIKN